MLYLECYEDNPKKGIATRLAEATAAYAARFGAQPNIILVSEHDAGATCAGCEVRVERRVRKDCYQVGKQE